MNIFGLFMHVLFWYGLPLLALGLIVLTIIDRARFVAWRIDAARPKHWGMAISGICFGTVIALGVGSIPLLDRDGPSLDPDWQRGLGLIAILMVPVALALVGLRRPGALLAAGVVSLPMCFMSFSFLLFPLLIPAAMYLIAYGRAAKSYTPRLAPAAVASLTFVLLVLSFMSLFMNEDPRCYEIVRRPDGSRFDRPLAPGESIYTAQGGRGVVGSGCSSDSVTPVEVTTSIGLVTLAAISATYLSGPRRSGKRAFLVDVDHLRGGRST